MNQFIFDKNNLVCDSTLIAFTVETAETIHSRLFEDGYGVEMLFRLAKINAGYSELVTLADNSNYFEHVFSGSGTNLDGNLS